MLTFAARTATRAFSAAHFAPASLMLDRTIAHVYWKLAEVAIPADVVPFPHLAADDFAEFVDRIRTRSVQLHTLGNLTLLNKYLNPAASNNSFDSQDRT
jgi:hypothetical protein